MTNLIAKIDAASVKSVNVYSVITCASTKGVCQICYGRDLAREELVSVGEAVDDCCSINWRARNTVNNENVSRRRDNTN